jgi:hypothetical protein
MKNHGKDKRKHSDLQQNMLITLDSLIIFHKFFRNN